MSFNPLAYLFGNKKSPRRYKQVSKKGNHDRRIRRAMFLEGLETRELMAVDAVDDAGVASENLVSMTLTTPSGATSLTANDSSSAGTPMVVYFDSASVKGAAVNVGTLGNFTYDPTVSQTLQGLQAGQTTTDSFTYIITDKTAVTSGFTVKRWDASFGDLNSVDTFLAGNPAPAITANTPVVNFFQSDGSNQRFTGAGTVSPLDDETPVPGEPANTDVNNYVVEATADIVIPVAGRYTFGVASDDGFGLAITGGATLVSVHGQNDGTSTLGLNGRLKYSAGRGTQDTFGVFDFPTAGVYSLRLVNWEGAGGSSVEMYAAKGDFGAAINATGGSANTAGFAAAKAAGANWVLAGDTFNSGIRVYNPGSNLDVATVTYTVNGVNDLNAVADTYATNEKTPITVTGLVTSPGMNVETYIGGGIDATFGSAQNLRTTRTPNFTGTATLAHFSDDNNDNAGPFGTGTIPPGINNGADDNNYAVYVYGTLRVTQPGVYTFGNYTDDASKLQIDLDQNGVLGNTASENVLTQNGCCGVPLSAPVTLKIGVYKWEAFYTEGGGGSHGEWFYTKGTYGPIASVNGFGGYNNAVAQGANFKRIGDASGGIESYAVYNDPGVLGNDFDEEAQQSIQTVTVTKLNGSTTLTGLSTLGAKVTLNPNGGFTYDPTFDPNSPLQRLAQGEVAADTFTYTVQDNDPTSPKSVTQTVTINVAGRNEVIDAVNNSYSTNENTPLVTTDVDTNPRTGQGDTTPGNAADDGVLVNDVDSDASDVPTVLRYDATTALGATVTMNANGTFTYNPATSKALQGMSAGQSLVDTFTYTATDGQFTSGPLAWDFGTTPNLQNWSLLNGQVNFRTGDGDGLTAAVSDGSFAQDATHVNLLIQSPMFRLNGGTVDGTNALVVEFAGGAGDQGNAGQIFNNPAAVIGYNGGNSNSSGQKGLAFLNTTTGQYTTTIFENDDGGTNVRSFTLAQLQARGLSLGQNYRLQYFDNDDGGWGWGQLNAVQIAAGLPIEDTATVTITVNGVNDAPVAVADSYATNENEALTVGGLATVGGVAYETYLGGVDSSLASAQNLRTTRTPNATGTTALANFSDPQGDNVGSFGAGIQPNGLGGGDDNNYAVYTFGFLKVTTQTTFTFGNYTDDASQLRIDLNQNGSLADAGETVMSRTNCCSTNLSAPVTITPGIYKWEAFYTEGGGGSHGEWFYTPGSYGPVTNLTGTTAFTNATSAGAQFRLFGDNGGGITWFSSLNNPGVLGNDTDEEVSVFTQTMSVTQLNGSATLTGTSTMGASVTINPDGSFTYNPNIAGSAVQALAFGQTAVDTFTYTVTDSDPTVPRSTTQTVSITVTGANDRPTTTNDSYSTNAVTSFTTTDVDLSPRNNVGDSTAGNTADDGVLVNDQDVDTSDTLQVYSAQGTALTGAVGTLGDGSVTVTTALGATVTISDRGTFTYNPSTSATLRALNPSQTATDSFVYTATDGSPPDGFHVRSYSPRNTGTLAATDTYLNAPVAAELKFNGTVPVINFFQSDTTNQHFTGVGTASPLDDETSVPGLPGGDIDNYVVEATGTLLIPAAGDYTFSVNSDDGFGLAITGATLVSAVGSSDGTSTLGLNGRLAYSAGRGSADSFGLFRFPSAGSYPIRLVNWEGSGGSSIEMFAAPGNFATFAATNTWRLVGDTVNGGLQVVDPASSVPFLRTATVNIQVQGVNDNPVGVNDPAFGQAAYTANENSTLIVPAAPISGVNYETYLGGGIDASFASAVNLRTTRTPNATGTTALANFSDPQGDNVGSFGTGIQPNGLGGGDDQNYAVFAFGTLNVTTAGVYTFGSYTDDASRLQIDLNQNGVLGDQANETILSRTDCCSTHLSAPVTLAKGVYRWEAFYTEGVGGSHGEWFYTPGSYGPVTNLTGTTAFTNATSAGAQFRLIGDAAGGIASYSSFTSLLQNDFDYDNGDSLTLDTATITSANGATITPSANGAFVYDPSTSQAAQLLIQGQTLTDTFVYTLKDSFGGSSTATATVTVTGVSDPVNDNYTVPESDPGFGVSLNVPAPGVLSNDALPEVLGTNVALGKAASQSTDYQGNPANGAQNAVDGNFNNLTHTADGATNSWWQVNLGALTDIGQILLFNRTDCCGNRLSNFRVSLWNGDPNVAGSTEVWGKNYFPTGSVGQGDTFAIRAGEIGSNGTRLGSTNGNFVRVQIVGPGGNNNAGDPFLSFREVQVWDSQPASLSVKQAQGNNFTGSSTFSPTGGGQVVLNSNGSFTYDQQGLFNSLAVGESQNVSFTYNVINNVTTGTATTTTSASGSAYPVLANDLLKGMIPTVTGNTLIGDENTSRDSITLTDGSFGLVGGLGTSGASTLSVRDNTVLTYALDTEAYPSGYVIQNVDVYSGWQDAGRSNQNYTLRYSLVGAPDTFIDLTTVNFVAGQAHAKSTIAAGANAILTGVAKLQFAFGAQQNGYVGYREIDVTGFGIVSGVTTTIKVTGVNDLPTVVNGGPYSIAAGQNLSLNATGTTDVDTSNVLTYKWDFNNDGTNDLTTTNPVATYTWNQLQTLGSFPPGTYPLKLTVNDGTADVVSNTTFTITPTFLFNPVADGVADGYTLVLNAAQDRIEIHDTATFTLITSSPRAGITKVLFAGNADQETVTIDFRNTSPIPVNGVDFNGGAPVTSPGDSLAFVDNTNVGVSTMVYSSTNNTDGTVTINGGVVTYTGLEDPISDSLKSVTKTFNFGNAANEAIVLKNSTVAGFNAFIDSPLAAAVNFTNPTTNLNLTVSGGGGDTIDLQTAGLASNFNVTGTGNDDVVNVTGNVTVTGAFTSTISAVPSINFNGGVLSSNSTVLNAGVITTNGTGNDVAGTNLTATAVTGIDLDTTVTNATLNVTGAGNAKVDSAGAINLTGVSVANGNLLLTATGAITDAASGVISVSGNASLSAPSVTLGETGTDSVNFGSLTFTSGGAVAVSEDSALNLAGTNTAGSAALASTVTIADAAGVTTTISGLMDVSAPAITLGSGTFNAGTLKFNSTGAVSVSEGSSIDIAGVNTAGSANLSTSTGIADSGATSVDITGLLILSGAAISLGGGTFNAGSINFTSTSMVDITEDSTLVLSGTNSSTGTTTLTTVDTAGTDNVSIPSGATLSASSINLNAGDDAIIAGSVTSSADVHIKIDFGSTDAAGGAANITGPISTPSSNYTFVDGNVQNDSITITPSNNTEFRVFGDQPTGTSIGDALHMIVTGLGATLSAPGTVFTGNGSGDFTFATGQRPVRFGSIEQLDAVGTFNLIFNNDVQKSSNVVVMLDTTASPNTRLEIRDGSNTGPILISPVLSSVLSLTINGNTSNVAEQVTIDDIHGLPTFTGTPTLSPDNASVAGLPGVYFVGNDGTNTLAFNLTAASTSQVVGLGDGVTGAPDSNAEVGTSNGSGASLNAFGSSLAGIHRTGVGSTPGSLTVQAEDGNDTLDIAAGSGDSTNITATDYVTFNFDQTNNYSAVAVVGNGGNDSLKVSSLGGTNNATPVTLNGGIGNDTLGVGSGNLTSIFAPVTLIGGTGNDTASVDNSASTVANTATVRENQIDKITGRNLAGDVSYTSLETLSVLTSSMGDTITINMDTVPGGNVVTATVNGGSGDDQFLFSAASDPALDKLNLQGGTGNDVFGTAPAGGLGSAPTGGEFVPSSGVQIVISGESSTSTSGPNPTTEQDQLNLNLSSFLTAEIVDAGSGQVLSLGTMPAHDPFYFNGIEDLNLYDGGKLTNTEVGDLYLRSTDDNTNDNILFYKGYTSPQDVLLRFNNKLASTTPFRPTGHLVAYGRGGSDRMELNYTLGNILSAQFYGEEGNDYLTGSFKADILVGGGGSDQLVGGDGNDILWGDQEGVTWAQRSGDNSLGSTDSNDVLEGDAGDDFMFGGGGNDQLTGMTGNDYLHGGFGDDNLVGADGNDILRAGDGNDSLTGDKGNDILVGGIGNDFLYGAADRDFAFSGSGGDRSYETNDTGEDVNITESNGLDFDTANSTYDPSNSSTFLGPNDSTLIGLLSVWSSTDTFANRSAAMRSALLPISTNDGSYDYLTGNTLTLDYSIVGAIGTYDNKSGDTVDSIS